MKRLALYIPGLGDHYDAGRSLALKGWKLWGVEARLLPIKWYDGGTYEQKLHLLVEALHEAIGQGYTVTLVGESAGASLALNAAAEVPDVARIVLIAGVNGSKLPISPHLQRRSPSFAESTRRIDTSLSRIDTRKIHTIRALADSVVSPRYNTISGATPHVFLSVGHITTIALCLSVFSFFVTRIIKQ
jgi:pimeloyl-ACP methyl ester carboxylesterase